VKEMPGDSESAETIPAVRSDASIQSLNNQIIAAEKKISDLSRYMAAGILI